MTIEDIQTSGVISVRSFNVCKDNGLEDLTSILDFYRKNKTFDNLKNCGKKSNEELISLCLRYLDKDEELTLFIPQINEEFINLALNLTRIQKEVVNSFIEINYNNLQVRSQNVLQSVLGGDLKIKHISDTIFKAQDFNFKDIRNVGAKSIIELNDFLEWIKLFLIKVSNLVNENELKSLNNRFLIEKLFSIANIPNEVIESPSFFKITDFLIKENVLFEKNENIIFKKSLKVYKNQPKVYLDYIALDCDISKERVRQIRTKCLEKLSDYFQFIKMIGDNLLGKYGIDTSEDFIYIDTKTVDLVNKINGTNFSSGFIAFLICVYVSDKFELVGRIEDVLQHNFSNVSNRHRWENFYLVNRQITDSFDFDLLVQDVMNRLNEQINEDYKFSFRSYLTQFLRTENFRFLSVVVPIAEKIINCEFELFLNIDEELVFERNTVKQVFEYAIEALEELGEPSKVSDIYKLIEMKFPDVTKGKDALRGSLQRTPEIIYFGRSLDFGKKYDLLTKKAELSG